MGGIKHHFAGQSFVKQLFSEYAIQCAACNRRRYQLIEPKVQKDIGPRSFGKFVSFIEEYSVKVAVSRYPREFAIVKITCGCLFMLDTCAGEITTLGFSFSGKSLCGVAVIANLPSPSSTRRIRCSVVSLVAVSSSV